jgi:Ca-activated chloride channel family protein
MPEAFKHFQFAHLHWLWLLALVPLLGFLLGGRGRRSAVRFSSLHLLGMIAQRPRGAVALWAFLAAMLPLAAGAVALARPQSVRTEEKIEDSGIEIIIAMDVSLSMAIEDYTIDGRKANRLKVAKNVIRDFVAGRKSDRIGLVAFAGRPYVASPLTMDQKWFNQSLERVGFNLVEDGTAIGSALMTATSRLEKREAKSKIILLLTDGANNSGMISPTAAAKQAKTLGVKIYTVSIGTPGRHMIPVANRQGMMAGIRQEFDDETMQKVAEIGGGKAYKGQDTETVEKIFSEIDQLEKTKIHSRRTQDVRELFPYPVAAGLMLGILGIVCGQTLGRRHPE